MKRPVVLYCFTPLVTLVTFLIETALGAYALVRYRHTAFGKLSALLILLLGVFQFSEYMICKTGQPGFWTQLGWVSITLLPIIGYHLVTMISGKSRWVPTGYLMAAFFSAAILLDPAAASDVTCPGNYVNFASAIPVYGSAYALYYFWFIFFAAARLAQIGWKTGPQRQLVKWFFAGYAAFMLPAFVVYVLLPAPDEAFPSVLCGFAVFLALIVAGKVLPLYHKKRTD